MPIPRDTSDLIESKTVLLVADHLAGVQVAQLQTLTIVLPHTSNSVIRPEI